MSNPPIVKKKKPNWLPVVAAVIYRENSFLLGQRPEGGSLAGLWEFPGGKIELGELPETAVKRELMEELGIEIDLEGLILATTHKYDETGVVLLFYLVKYWKGEALAKHHKEIRWVKQEDIQKMPMPEANAKVLPRLMEGLKHVLAQK